MAGKIIKLLLLGLISCTPNEELYRFDLNRFLELGNGYNYLNYIPEEQLYFPEKWDDLIKSTASIEQRLNLQLGQLYFMLLKSQSIAVDWKNQRIIFAEQPLLVDLAISVCYFKMANESILYFSDKDKQNYKGCIRKEGQYLYMERGNKIYPYKKYIEE